MRIDPFPEAVPPAESVTVMVNWYSAADVGMPLNCGLLKVKPDGRDPLPIEKV